MNWIMVKISTTTKGIEPVTGRLYQIGITGAEIEDAADFNDFLENNTKYWDYVDEELLDKGQAQTCVKVYITDNQTGLDMLNQIKSELSLLKSMDLGNEFGSLEAQLSNISEQDWAQNWKRYYKPLKIGERVLIKPEWEEVGDCEERVIFNINPGMSFGTGTHQSTQLCIEQIERYIKNGDSVLDLGCGSGILSIISMLLGAKEALAIDIDPNAADIARKNALLNSIDHKNYKAIAGDVLTDTNLLQDLKEKKYNIVLVNIVADVIISLSENIKELLKKDAILIASGIILFRLEEVKSALVKNGLEIIDIITKDDWAAVVAK